MWRGIFFVAGLSFVLFQSVVSSNFLAVKCLQETKFLFPTAETRRSGKTWQPVTAVFSDSAFVPLKEAPCK